MDVRTLAVPLNFRELASLPSKCHILDWNDIDPDFLRVHLRWPTWLGTEVFCLTSWTWKYITRKYSVSIARGINFTGPLVCRKFIIWTICVYIEHIYVFRSYSAYYRNRFLCTSLNCDVTWRVVSCRIKLTYVFSLIATIVENRTQSRDWRKFLRSFVRLNSMMNNYHAIRWVYIFCMFPL